jgi:hypothetical protein
MLAAYVDPDEPFREVPLSDDESDGEGNRRPRYRGPADPRGPAPAPSAYPTYIQPSPKPVNQEIINAKLNALGPPSPEEKQFALEIIAAEKIRDFAKKYEILSRTPRAVEAAYTRRQILVSKETGIQSEYSNFQVALNILEAYYSTYAGGRRSKTRKGKGKRKHRKAKTAKRRARR